MKKVCGIILAFGFILLLGTAGASDIDNIGQTQLYIQAGTSVVLMAAGLIGLYKIENNIGICRKTKTRSDFLGKQNRKKRRFNKFPASRDEFFR